MHPNEVLIGDHNGHLFQLDQVVNGDRKARGGIPRDYSVQPKEMFDPPSGITVYPRADVPGLLAEQAAKKARISDLRGGMPALDQGQYGYCWSHSVTTAIMLSRIVQGQPYRPLSAFCIAATIKRGRNEGGWCGLAAQFARETGVMTQATWPQGDAGYQRYDKPENWTEAARYRVTEEYADLTRDVYDQNLTFDQLIWCLLNGFPCATDFNHWSHSVCGCDIVDGVSERESYRDPVSGKLPSLPEFDAAWGMSHPVTGGLGLRILNSWSNGWGDRGFGLLTGSKAIPDGAIAVRVTGAAR